MTTDRKHTPLPWIKRDYDADEAECGSDVVSAHGEVLFTYASIENADFIVRSCNNHYKLLDALKDIYAMANVGGSHRTICAIAKKAMAEVEGK